MVSNLEDLKIYALALANGTMIGKPSQDERLKFVNTSADIMKYGLGIFSFGGLLATTEALPDIILQWDIIRI